MLLHDIELATDAAFATRVRGIVIEGRTAEIDSRTFEPCLEMHTETLGPYELGFDFEASRRDKVVRGVGPATRAYAAGLRDGERFRACSIHGNQPQVPVEVEVGDGEARRKITWLPEGKSVPVPQFSVREGATSSDCAGL
jgi:predicted metalloprotease with PDZ domain